MIFLYLGLLGIAFNLVGMETQAPDIIAWLRSAKGSIIFFDLKKYNSNNNSLVEDLTNSVANLVGLLPERRKTCNNYSERKVRKAFNRHHTYLLMNALWYDEFELIEQLVQVPRILKTPVSWGKVLAGELTTRKGTIDDFLTECLQDDFISTDTITRYRQLVEQYIPAEESGSDSEC
jgi:hypothetical protein